MSSTGNDNEDMNIALVQGKSGGGLQDGTGNNNAGKTSKDQSRQSIFVDEADPLDFSSSNLSKDFEIENDIVTSSNNSGNNEEDLIVIDNKADGNGSGHSRGSLVSMASTNASPTSVTAGAETEEDDDDDEEKEEEEAPLVIDSRRQSNDNYPHSSSLPPPPPVRSKSGQYRQRQQQIQQQLPQVQRSNTFTSNGASSSGGSSSSAQKRPPPKVVPPRISFLPTKLADNEYMDNLEDKSNNALESNFIEFHDQREAYFQNVKVFRLHAEDYLIDDNPFPNNENKKKQKSKRARRKQNKNTTTIDPAGRKGGSNDDSFNSNSDGSGDTVWMDVCDQSSSTKTTGSVQWWKYYNSKNYRLRMFNTFKDRFAASSAEGTSSWKRRMVYFCVMLLIVLLVVVIGSVAFAKNDTTEIGGDNTLNNNDNEVFKPPIIDTTNLSKEVKESIDHLVDFVSHNDITGKDIFNDIQSPQYKAIAWIVTNDSSIYNNNDQNDIVIPYHTNVDIKKLLKNDYTVKKFIQKYSLLTFYFALDGENWENQLDFMSVSSSSTGGKKTFVDECDWNKVYEEGSVNELIPYGVTCNNVGEIITLLSPGNNLFGSIPSEISLLTSLELIFLNGNDISGELPSSMSTLTNVNTLALYDNQLSGSIPSFIGNEWNKNFHTLELAYNQFSGSLPPTLGLLENIQTIDLESNNLHGDLPMQLANLKSSPLSTLVLTSNELSGNIDVICDNLINLNELRLNNNAFTGEIPISVEKLSSLELLYLDENKFVGNPFGNIAHDTPPYLNALTKLKGLFLQNNMLTGSITTDFLNKLTNLQILDVSNNLLQAATNYAATTNPSQATTSETNVLPVELLNHVDNDLQILDIHSNQIEGSLSHTFDLLDDNNKLKFLRMHDNDITGTIPIELTTTFHQLTHLDISSNLFSGSINDIPFQGMGQLQQLFMSDNPNFEDGPIPLAFIEMSTLRELSLSGTNRNEQLFDWLDGRFNNLRLLDVSNNALTGTIPDSLSQMTNLYFLLLNKNELIGTVPDGFRDLKNLFVLTLDGNHLHGTADDVFCDEDNFLYGINMRQMTGDCKAMDNNPPEFACKCCTSCCSNVDDGGVNECTFENEMLERYQPLLKEGYDRENWDFDQELSFNFMEVEPNQQETSNSPPPKTNTPVPPNTDRLGITTSPTSLPSSSPTKTPAPTFKPGFLKIVADHGIPAKMFPLGWCQGDCDTDDDCDEELECFDRLSTEDVPGCDGEGEFARDYCYDPTLN